MAMEIRSEATDLRDTGSSSATMARRTSSRFSGFRASRHELGSPSKSNLTPAYYSESAHCAPRDWNLIRVLRRPVLVNHGKPQSLDSNRIKAARKKHCCIHSPSSYIPKTITCWL